MFSATDYVVIYVVVLGEQPSQETDEALMQILAQGEMAPLPSTVLAALNSIRDATNDPMIDGYDLPFSILSSQLGAAAVVTDNRKHFTALGANTIGNEDVNRFMVYESAKSVELTIKVGGFFVIIAATESATATWRLGVWLAQSYVRLPLWLRLLVLAMFSGFVLHPRGRVMLGNLAWSGSEGFHILADILGAILRTLATETAKAADAQRHLKQAIPDLRRKKRLEDVAYSVCRVAEEPLSLTEIARAVRSRGYQSRSRYFVDYLRRVLRKNGRFVRCADGLWTVSHHSSLSQLGQSSRLVGYIEKMLRNSSSCDLALRSLAVST